MRTKNRYQGINEYAVKIITYRAKTLIGKAGYKPKDLEDIEQDLMLDLIERLDKYDSAKAKLSTFIDRIVDHKIANLLEERRAAKRDLSKTFTTLDTPFEGSDGQNTTLLDITGTDEYLERMGYQDKSSLVNLDTEIDLDLILKKLPSDDLRILSLLAGRTLVDVAKELGMPRTTLIYKIQKIRKALCELGLDESWRRGSSF